MIFVDQVNRIYKFFPCAKIGITPSEGKERKSDVQSRGL